MDFMDECKANPKAWESIELAKLHIQKGPGEIPGTVHKKDLLQGLVLLKLEVEELKKSLQAIQEKEIEVCHEKQKKDNDAEETGKKLDEDKEGEKTGLINNVKKPNNKTNQENLTEDRKICPKHLQSQCPNPKGCKFEHPGRCFKIMHFGLKQFDDRGCDLSCDKAHPRMCHKDMKFGNCKNRNCKGRHLVRRHNPEMASQKNRHTSNNYKSNPSKNWSREPHKPPTQESDAPNSFLEMQKMMKELLMFQREIMQDFLRKRD